VTFEHRKLCEKHPDEPVQYCSLCLREVRLDTREECAALTKKMQEYRDAILGLADLKKRLDS
jgi:hypothetical protein